MKYNELSDSEIKTYEKTLLDKAEHFWITNFDKQEPKEPKDVTMLRYLFRQQPQTTFYDDVKKGYLWKKGLWHDGQTTLEERAQQLKDKKKKFGKKIAKLRDKKVKDINEIIEEAQKKKEEILTIPEKMKEEYGIESRKILKETEDELKLFYDAALNQMTKNIENLFQQFEIRYKEKQEILIANTKEQMDDLQKNFKNRITNEVRTFSAELEAELTILDYKEEDDFSIRKYEQEIEKINQELNLYEGNQNSKRNGNEDTGVCEGCLQEFSIAGGVLTKHKKTCKQYQQLKQVG